FETPLALTGRNLTVRAGPGYRPLLVWDVPRTREERQKTLKSKPEEAKRGLSLLTVHKGNLTLQGIDLVCRWPGEAGEKAALVEVGDADLTVTDCTFSVSGKHQDRIALWKLGNQRETGSRCRLTRCYSRGRCVTALDLDGTGLEVLIEGCLLTGGD